MALRASALTSPALARRASASWQGPACAFKRAAMSPAASAAARGQLGHPATPSMMASPGITHHGAHAT
eukprot:1841971-Alexandrium_andersonii.AAC.1